MVKINSLDSRTLKGAGNAPSSSDVILQVVTNNVDIPAQMGAGFYPLRWTIELSFCIIKQLLGCRDLISHKQNGETIQIYMTVLAWILILSLMG